MTESRSRLLWWLLALVWMALIFAMSSRIGSSENSGWLISGLFGLSGYWLDIANGLLRKCAHMTEYAILGVLVYTALRRAHGFGARAAAATGILLASAYACSDEIHQLFVPGREGQVIDWLTDTTGALIGLGLWSRRARRREKE